MEGGWTPWGCLWGPTTVRAQHNSDSVHSEIPFNLAHLLHCCSTLSHAQHIYPSLVWWSIPFWSSWLNDSLLMQPGALQRMWRRKLAALGQRAAPCHQAHLLMSHLSIRLLSRMMTSEFSFDQLEQRLHLCHICFSQHSSFHLFPEIFCIFTCLFCNCHSLIFLSSLHFCPEAEKRAIYTRLICDTASHLNSRSRWVNVHRHYPWC